MSKNLNVLSIRDLARLWGMHPHTISRGLNGQLKIDLPPAFKIGGQWRFREDDVEEHLNRLSGRVSTDQKAFEPDQAISEVRRKPGRPRKAIALSAMGSAA